MCKPLHTLTRLSSSFWIRWWGVHIVGWRRKMEELFSIKLTKWAYLRIKWRWWKAYMGCGMIKELARCEKGLRDIIRTISRNRIVTRNDNATSARNSWIRRRCDAWPTLVSINRTSTILLDAWTTESFGVDFGTFLKTVCAKLCKRACWQRVWELLGEVLVQVLERCFGYWAFLICWDEFEVWHLKSFFHEICRQRKTWCPKQGNETVILHPNQVEKGLWFHYEFCRTVCGHHIMNHNHVSSMLFNFFLRRKRLEWIGSSCFLEGVGSGANGSARRLARPRARQDPADEVGWSGDYIITLCHKPPLVNTHTTPNSS